MFFLMTTEGHRDSMGHVMERARTEGGNRWTKKLLDEEAKNPERYVTLFMIFSW